jgi:TM2 domain-containing membrane protein YozV
MTVQGLEIVHALPGRVRLKVARLKRDPDLAREAQTRLAGVPGITAIEANPTTGSLLVCYEAERLKSLESLAALSEALGPLAPELDPARLSGWLAQASAGGALDAGGARALLGRGRGGRGGLAAGINLNLMIPLTLLFLGMRSLWLAEKTAFPAWYDYLWFAFSTFALLNRTWLEDAAGPEKHG